MKNVKPILVFLLCAILLLSGCSTLDESADTTLPTVESTTPAETTEPTVPPTTEPATEPVELPTDEEYFAAFLTGEYWYWRALGCTFAEPEEINAKFYFYTDLDVADRQRSDTFTDAEINFLESQWKESYGEGAWQNAHKLPTDQIEKALSILNVGLSDIAIPDEWVYFAETDAYYDLRYDAYGVVGVTVTDVVTAGDTVRVFWTAEMVTNTLTGEHMRDPQMVISLLKLEDGSYRVLSNMPVESLS